MHPRQESKNPNIQSGVETAALQIKDRFKVEGLECKALLA